MGSSTTDIMKIRLSAEGIQDVVNALKKVEVQAKQVKGAGDGVGSKLRDEFRDLGIAVAVQQMASYIKSNIDAQAAVQDLVEVTGASAEAVSTLGIAAKREGVEIEKLGKGIRGLTKFLGEIQTGGTEASQTLAALGLSAKDLVGKSLDQQLETLAGAFDTFSDDGQSGMNKTAVAMKIFGKAGEDMRQVLQQLSDGGFARLREEGKKTGEVLSTEAAQKAKEAKLELAKLEGQTKGLTNAFSQGLIPELINLGNALSGNNDEGRNFAKTLGSWGGAMLKGVVAYFLTIGKAIGGVLATLDLQLTTAAAGAGALWDVITGKASIKDLPQRLKFIKESFRVQSESISDGTKDSILKNWEDLFGEKTPAEGGQAGQPASGTGGPTPKPAGKKTLTLADPASMKARIAEQVAAAKRLQDLQSQELSRASAEWEDLFKEGLLDLDSYLALRRSAISTATSQEIALLTAQLEAERKIRATSAKTPAERKASDTRVADLENQIEVKKAQGASKEAAEIRTERDLRRDAAMDAIKLEEELEAAKGETGEAAIRAIQAEYDLRIRLAKTPEARAALTNLKDSAEARVGLDRQNRKVDLAKSTLGMQLGSVDAQQGQGLITDDEAIQRKIGLYQEMITVLEAASIEQLRLAQGTGKPEDLLRAQENIVGVEQLKVSLKGLTDQVNWVGVTARSAFQEGLGNLLMDLTNQTTTLTEKILALGKAIAQAIMQQATAKMAASVTAFLFPAAKASGGPIMGPGTGTSDSVPIWASAGEYMIKAAAVDHYGPGFLHAVNGMRFPKGSVPRFAQGGLIGGGGGSTSNGGLQPLIGSISIVVNADGSSKVSAPPALEGVGRAFRDGVIGVIRAESRPGGKLYGLR